MNTFAKIANTAAKESQAIRIASKERLRHRVAQCCLMRAQMTWFLVLAVSILPTMPGQLLASDGDLDITFGNAGRTTGLSGFARAMALQPDGKIVVAGWRGPYPGSDFAIARYNSDGSLDSSFGIQGQTTTDLGGTEEAFAVALQPDGKIVVAGSKNAGETSSRFVLARYNDDGSLDATFGIEGVRSCELDARAVVVQPDSKILVAGTTVEYGWDFALARYNSDGSPDLGYGIGGKVTTDFSGRNDQAYALALQADGKIVAAGTSYHEVEGGLALARYNTDGSIDSAFGIGGQVLTDPDGDMTTAYAVALQPDGKIVIAGGGLVVESLLRLVRYNSDGSLDATFATAGKVNPFEPDARSLALQSDGKIVIGTMPGVGVVSLARYNSDGSLDATFGIGGYVGDGEGATALAIQSDGKIIALGYALARYNSNLPTLSFHPPCVVLGDSFTATFSGTSLNDETYFDVRFRSPGASTDRVTLNWQRGISATHSAHTLTGTWTITGIHPHQNMDDHTPAFVPVSIDLKVTP